MKCETITVINPSGLHLRPAGVLSTLATKCKSEVTIIYGTIKINAKSVLNVISSGVKKGAEIEIQCEGENEEEDLRTMIDAIASGLGELIDR